MIYPAWIVPHFRIPVWLTSCQKYVEKCSGNWSPTCSLQSLTSLFEVLCLEPSKSWFQTTSRQNAVSWVHGTFAEINYYPDTGEEGGGGNISSKPCTNVRSASRKKWAADRPIVFQSTTKIFLTSEMFRTLSGAIFEHRWPYPCKKHFQKINIFVYNLTHLS